MGTSHAAKCSDLSQCSWVLKIPGAFFGNIFCSKQQLRDPDSRRLQGGDEPWRWQLVVAGTVEHQSGLIHVFRPHLKGRPIAQQCHELLTKQRCEAHAIICGDLNSFRRAELPPHRLRCFPEPHNLDVTSINVTEEWMDCFCAFKTSPPEMTAWSTACVDYLYISRSLRPFLKQVCQFRKCLSSHIPVILDC